MNRKTITTTVASLAKAWATVCTRLFQRVDCFVRKGKWDVYP